jgi:YNFM family putative membrane transporter
MSGRVLTAGIAELASWRTALAVIALVGLAAALLFLLLLPPSRHFTPRRGLGLRFHLATWQAHLRHPGLRALFLIGFLIMGVFVTAYNYAAFHLLAPPFSLSQGSVGLIFTVYLVGVFASSIGGALGDRYGQGRIMQASLTVMALGLATALLPSLIANIAGIALITLGFFGAHCMASSWVGRMAPGARGHAAALYLLIYYLGSSLLGTLGGWFWSVGAWPAVIGFMLALTLLGALAAWRLPARAL